MGSPAAFKPKKPNEGMFGTFKGKPNELKKKFDTAKSEKGELEGLNSVRKKYNIKSKYVYPREKALLAKKTKEEEKEKKGYTLSNKNLLGQ